MEYLKTLMTDNGSPIPVKGICSLCNAKCSYQEDRLEGDLQWRCAYRSGTSDSDLMTSLTAAIITSMALEC